VRTIGGEWKRFQEFVDIKLREDLSFRESHESKSGTTGIQVRTALNGEEHGTSRKIKYTIQEAFDLEPELYQRF
jgi:hypothetical protein